MNEQCLDVIASARRDVALTRAEWIVTVHPLIDYLGVLPQFRRAKAIEAEKARIESGEPADSHGHGHH